MPREEEAVLPVWNNAAILASRQDDEWEPFLLPPMEFLPTKTAQDRELERRREKQCCNEP